MSAHDRRIRELLERENLLLSELQEAVFHSCPEKYRGSCWKLMLDYLPLTRSERADRVTQRRLDYRQYVLELAGEVTLESFSPADQSEETEAESPPGPPSPSPASPSAEGGGPLHTSNLFGSPSKVGTLTASTKDLESLLSSLGGEGGGEGEEERGGGGDTSTTPATADTPSDDTSAATIQPPPPNEEDSPLSPPSHPPPSSQPPSPPEDGLPSEAARRVAKELELRREIAKDVERTHSELAFFNNPLHTASMARILLVYAKLNAGVLYIQGMNELLAPLLYVCVMDGSGEVCGVPPSTSPSPSDSPSSGSAAAAAPPSDAEADTFFLFASLMAVHRDVFIQAQDNCVSGIKGQLARFGRALGRREPAVSAHLRELGITPQFYALRWLTTLCTTELPFPDTLMMWDRLLSDTPPASAAAAAAATSTTTTTSPSSAAAATAATAATPTPSPFSAAGGGPGGAGSGFLMPFCVAIIRAQRRELLGGGFGEVMKCLQRTPIGVDFLELLQLAMEVREEETVDRVAAMAAAGVGGGGGMGAVSPLPPSSSSSSSSSHNFPHGEGNAKTRGGGMWGALSRESSWAVGAGGGGGGGGGGLLRENSWLSPTNVKVLPQRHQHHSQHQQQQQQQSQKQQLSPGMEGEGGGGNTSPTGGWLANIVPSTWSLFRGPSPPPPSQ